MTDTADKIRAQIKSDPVVLYMKGSPDFPQCGFSANACNILRACGVEDFYTVNVLDGSGQTNLTNNDATDTAAKWGGG